MSKFTLPFPPSANNMFTNAVTGRRVSPRYAKWRDAAGWSLKEQKAKTIPGKVAILIELVAPDNRERDCDNNIKPVLDLLVRNRVIDGDDAKTVRMVTALWKPKGEPCTVIIQQLKSADEVSA